MRYFLLSFIFCACVACEKETTELLMPGPSDCGRFIIIDGGRLEAGSGDNFMTKAVALEDLCLTVTIEATGCSTEGWSLDLVTVGDVKESLPTQTSATLLFDDGLPEDGVTCQAIVEETYTFDLSPYLGNAGTLPSRLTVVGADTTLLVE